MLFDGEKFKCDACDKVYDEFKKAYDCRWKDRNILSTIKQIEERYGREVFNEMVSLFLKENPIE